MSGAVPGGEAPRTGRGRVLVIDDDADALALLVERLSAEGFSATGLSTGREAFSHLGQAEVDVVLTDYQLAGMNGLEICRHLAERHPDVPAILITGHGSKDLAISAIRSCAYDLLAKPVPEDFLIEAVDRALRHRQRTHEATRLELSENRSPVALAEIVGSSLATRGMLDLVARVAATDASVLVTGESGTGKELVARAVHEGSRRAQGPFIAVNCAAMPEHLLESELFGHARGAFTDAERARDGLLVRASGGTLLLDEIGEMPLEMQVKMLRALQERQVRPVGGNEDVPFDARLVTATHRDLEKEVREGRFRADLMYRIDVVRVPVAPLRERGGDVIELANHFLRRHSDRRARGALRLAPSAVMQLMAYDWPGNVRELENCIERAAAIARGPDIADDDLPAAIRAHESSRLLVSGLDPAEMPTLDEMERRYVRRVVAAFDGNKSRAATALVLDRRSLYRLLKSLGIRTGGTGARKRVPRRAGAGSGLR